MIRKKGEKPTLADIDGTVPGRAVLVSARVDQDDPATMSETYDERPGDKYDPWTVLLGLQRSLVDDWPNRGWTIVGNWRAQYLRWLTTMGEILPGQEFGPQDYLESFK